MNNIAFYDPLGPEHNDYLSRVYFASLRGHLRDNGWGYTELTGSGLDLDNVKDQVVLCNGVFLKPTQILRLKENGNKIVAWDINDSSWLVEAYRMAPELELIDLVFKVAGIQNTRVGTDMVVEEDFTIRLVDREFLPEPEWARYRRMADSGRLQSLPYAQWCNTTHARVPGYAERERKVLIRGGNHYQRYILFLHLLARGLIAQNSWFSTADYFKEGMRPDFRYCARCCAEFEKHGAVPFDGSGEVGECSSIAHWGNREGRSQKEEVKNGEGAGSVTYQNGHWDNRCPRSFYWLAARFWEKQQSTQRSTSNGGNAEADKAFLVKALNGAYSSTPDFYEDLGNVLFYSDLKWMFSIYAPPRFWEGASIRTLNLLPKRTTEQSYFPALVEGDHYLTFKEDFSDLGAHQDIDEASYQRITGNALETFETWIRGGKYTVSDNLLRHICENMDRVTTVSDSRAI